MYPSARFLKSIFTRGQAQLLSSWWQFFSRKDKAHCIFPQGSEELALSLQCIEVALCRATWGEVLPYLAFSLASWIFVSICTWNRWNLCWDHLCMSAALSAHRNIVIFTPANVVHETKHISETSKPPLHEWFSLHATMIVQTALQIYVAAWSLQTRLSSLFTGSCLHGKKLMSSEARFENI